MFLALALPLLMALRFAPELPAGQVARQPQIALSGNTLGMVWGAGNAVWFATSTDGAKSFGKPVKLGEAKSKLPLGRRRGPRIAMAGKGLIYVTAIDGGDVLLWRSTDTGRTWSQPKRINDVPDAAREGFETIAAQGQRVFVAWLDLRSTGMKMYGATSDDGGVNWGDNRLIYASPDGHICECCHATAAIGPDGTTYVMFRNWLDGNRDMYLASSSDGGKTWQAPRKLGDGSWKLEACPMDGGSAFVGEDGKVLTAWRRDSKVYLSAPGEPEREVGPGTQIVAVQTAGGPALVWNEGPALRLKAGAKAPMLTLSPAGAFASLATDGDRTVYAAWEERGALSVERIDIR